MIYTHLLCKLLIKEYSILCQYIIMIEHTRYCGKSDIHDKRMGSENEIKHNNNIIIIILSVNWVSKTTMAGSFYI